jgi:hypothetical protein
MKRLLSIFCFVILCSCNYFENKKVYSEDLLKEELQTIDWNAVDEYPSFSVCDSVSEQQDRKECFKNTLLQHVNQYLSKQTIVVSQDVEDTIALKLAIDKVGNVKVLNIKVKPETLVVIPEIDSLLLYSIKSLPKVFPATKRGQPVDTEFVLPVIISIE